MARRRKSNRNGDPATIVAVAESGAARNWILFLCALVSLLILTAWIYAPVTRYGFVSLDDPIYVEGRVEQGITSENVRWAFSSVHGAAYLPLTLLSHMLDREIFGGWAGGHHLTNVFLHLTNTLLVLVLFLRSTRTRWPSLFVAALFAAHPLHVEAVAWVAERKELLCTFFELLAFLAFLAFLEKRTPWRYVASLLSFVLALLSKSMAITFPFLLLLFDVWPLGRLDLRQPLRRSGVQLGKLLVEKAPFFAVLPLVAWLAILGQSRGTAIAPTDKLQLADRLANAVLAYGRYLGDTLFPNRLAAYYVHPQGRHSVPLVLLAAAVLVAITAAVFLFGRRRPYLPVGWFWYLGTLVPVIGLVQVGLQSSADRYTYVPLIGLFALAAWGLRDLTRLMSDDRRRLMATIAAVSIVVFAGLSRLQVSTWRDSEVLYRRILRFSPECPIALVNLGAELGEQRKFAEAAELFARASRVTRLPPLMRLNWCYCLSRLERQEDAAACFRMALAEDSSSGQAHFQLGLTLSKLQLHADALESYRQAAERGGTPLSALSKVGDAYRISGLPEQASEVYRIVLKKDPHEHAALAGLDAISSSPPVATAPPSGSSR